MEKRGQIYFLAAIIISGLIISIGLIHNIATAPKTDTQIFDLSKEIDFEASKVIDWGIYQEKNTGNIKEKIFEENQLLKRYLKANPRTEFAIVFSDARRPANFKVTYYKVDTKGGVSASTGGAATGVKVFRQDTGNLDLSVEGKKAIITLPDRKEANEYTFDIKDGYNFYVILIKDQDNAQRLVAAPERKQ